MCKNVCRTGLFAQTLNIGAFTLVYRGFIVAILATEAYLLKIKLDLSNKNKLWPNYYISTDELGPVL
jgi:hypothetical protein